MRSKRLRSGDSGESSSTRKKPKTTRSKTGEGSKSSPNRDAEVVSDDVTMMNVVEPKMEERNEGSSLSSTTRLVREATNSECRFVGDPVPSAEARERWPERFVLTEKHTESDGEDVLYARLHFTQAQVDGCVYNLDDNAYVKGEDDEPDYIARIVEMFESTNHKLYFTAQWFFRAEDTVIKGHANLIDDKRVFISDIKTETPLACIISKLNIVKVDLSAKALQIPPCDFYYDMMYSMPYSTFANLSTGNVDDCETSSTTSFEGVSSETNTCNKESSRASTFQKPEMTLLDLYSGCGAMSTGLCFGATMSGVNLVSRWAVDINTYACQSLKHNHPETQVRNETAENFFALLKEWEKLCSVFSLLGTRRSQLEDSHEANTEDDQIDNESSVPSGEFEVEKLNGICFGDPNKMKKVGLYFQVRWKGYGPSDDTWEPIDGLGKCDIKLKEFVTSGYKSNILPLPGDVDVICGGPPCQGISGFNRFRNAEAPLEDKKNHQLVVYMDIVNHLKPKYLLMENVVDILKFSGGYLGRYALGRLVAMNYQTRLGMMAAGCYGLPQFRMRAFLWGARCNEKLPQYPLPTHEVVVRGIYPTEFEMNVVAYCEDETCVLENALLLSDAISDLPSVTNDESRDEMPYGNEAQTEFQQYIRLSKSELLGTNAAETNGLLDALLHDHRPKQMNEDDYQRACHIPKEKGANFRNLPGVSIGPDNKVMWDERVERVILPSGKPLVPDYAMSFVKGSSSKPFGRLWWDEIIATVVTRAEPHNQAVLHPEQDRVLTIRENARLQGFPDYYKLFGPVKERYIQVGNAVAVPVARALGYALGLASQGKCGDEPLFTLPPKFAHSVSFPLASIDDEANC